MKTKNLKLLKHIAITLLFSALAVQFYSGGTGAGNCLSFDGVNDYVSLPFIPNGNQGTIEGWFKTGLTPNDGEGNAIWSMGKTTFDGVHAWISYSDIPAWYSGARMRIYVNTGFGDTGFHLYGSTELAPSTWYHFAFVQDGVSPKLYLNGIKEILTAVSTPNNDNTVWWNDMNAPNTHNMGVLQRSTYIGFAEMSLDEIRIWNRALTQAEIRQNMCQRLKGNESGLMGYWRFDEGSGNTIYDASGNGNDGTLY